MSRTKRSPKKAHWRPLKAKRKSGATIFAYKVAGKTRDGVKLLRAKARPTSFTSREIRGAIAGLVKGGQLQG
jgi:hypothetical protein